MDAIVSSFQRDHREIEALLSILERECDIFRRAGHPDYELIGDIIDYFRSFLDQYYHPKENVVFKLTRMRNDKCGDIVCNIANERAAAATSLQALDDCLRDILKDQRVLRETFDDAARDFIRHERRQIRIEEEQLFPAVLLILTPADWAAIDADLRDQRQPLLKRGLEERLRARHRWISREALVDQAERRSTSGPFKA